MTDFEVGQAVAVHGARGTVAAVTEDGVTVDVAGTAAFVPWGRVVEARLVPAPAESKVWPPAGLETKTPTV